MYMEKDKRYVKATYEIMEQLLETDSIDDAISGGLTIMAKLFTSEAAAVWLIDEKEKQIVAYDAEIAQDEKAIKEFDQEIADQNRLIAQVEAQIAADREALNESARTHYIGGKFAIPAPQYTRVSDEYGTRMHPTLHVQKFHNGIDLAAPGGSPIVAAYDGKVVAAGYSSSMGNYVMIDHGDNLYTIYMHASALSVSQGTKVTKG